LIGGGHRPMVLVRLLWQRRVPMCPGVTWTEQVQKPCCAPVKLGRRLINKRGPDVVEHGLRLSTLVIRSRPAQQPAAGDSAVAQPTTTRFTGLVRAPEPICDMPPRHIPRPTSLRALHCVPSRMVVCAWLPEPCPAVTGGSGFTIETGSQFAIGISRTRCRVVDRRTRQRVEASIGGRTVLSQPLTPASKSSIAVLSPRYCRGNAHQRRSSFSSASILSPPLSLPGKISK